MTRRALGLAVLLLGCGSQEETQESGPSTGSVGSSSTSASTSSTTTSSTTTSAGTTSSNPTTSTSTSAGTTQGSSGPTTSATGSTGTTGEVACPKNVVLMGYWPPTNEMLRQFSTNPQQNPGDWEGENWRGLGYDVYAFFPEFPPDGDPSNDSFGSEGRVGSPLFDLQVDYQATSEDFWRIVDDYAPIILITTSRGGSIGWELEAIEGGHGVGNNSGPAFDWSSDGYGSEVRPVQASVDARSWQAMTTYRQGTTIGSALPMQAIFDATDGLTVASVEIENGTSGNYLSGFLGLHGLHYNATESHNVAAGHIHVGIDVEVAVARLLLETSLETVIQEHPARSTGCSPIPSDP